MKLSERIFNIIDRSREFIEIVTGTDLMAMEGLPPRETTIRYLAEAADATKSEVAQLEAENAELKRECEALLHAVAHSPVYWKAKDTYTELRDVVDALLEKQE